MPPLFGLLTATGLDDIFGTVLVPSAGFISIHSQNINTASSDVFAFSGAGTAEQTDVFVEGGTRIAAATLAFSGDLSIVGANDSGMDAIWMGW